MGRATPTGRQGGYTYLLMLFVVAVAGYGLALLGESWHSAARREIAQQTEFALDAYAKALDSYRLATPDGASYRPLRLAELLEDRRAGSLRRHLRQLYPNPVSGRQDWVIHVDGLGIIAVCLAAAGNPALRCSPEAQ